MSIKVVKSFKFRAYVSKQGHQQLDRMLVDHCELYNAALENRKLAYKYHKESISKFDQFKELTLVRQDDPKWSSEHAFIARGTITRVDRAFSGFFSRVKRGEKPGYRGSLVDAYRKMFN